MNKIFLSRRNLQTLLNKLDRVASGDDSACSIIKFHNPADPEQYQQTMDSIVVTAVEDELFYQSRAPGQMHPADDPYQASGPAA